MNTPREFAAWIYHPFVHMQTTQFLNATQCSTAGVILRTAQSFLWSPEGGKQPFGTLPQCTAGQAFGTCHPESSLMWFGHTGFWPEEAPLADASLIRNMDLPDYGNVVTGFGWQDAVLRGLGKTTILYDHALAAISVADAAVSLHYVSGEVEVLPFSKTSTVLTLPPAAMMQVQGLPNDVVHLLQQAFTTVAVGTLYATWATVDVWWPTAGFVEGAFATSLPIGRAYAVGGNDLRFACTGTQHVEFWNQAMTGSQDVAMDAVAQQLSAVFNTPVPRPAAVSWQAWPQGVALWNVGIDREKVSQSLSRPLGDDVPLWWASSALSRTPGWVEGAIEMGTHQAALLQDKLF